MEFREMRSNAPRPSKETIWATVSHPAFVLSACEWGAVAASPFWCTVALSSDLKTSPTTVPRTPPSGFRTAVNRLHDFLRNPVLCQQQCVMQWQPDCVQAKVSNDLPSFQMVAPLRALQVAVQHCPTTGPWALVDVQWGLPMPSASGAKHALSRACRPADTSPNWTMWKALRARFSTSSPLKSLSPACVPN